MSVVHRVMVLVVAYGMGGGDDGADMGSGCESATGAIGDGGGGAGW